MNDRQLQIIKDEAEFGPLDSEYQVGQSVIVEFSPQNADYYNGNSLLSWPFIATITQCLESEKEYLVRDQDNNTFQITKTEIRELVG